MEVSSRAFPGTRRVAESMIRSVFDAMGTYTREMEVVGLGVGDSSNNWLGSSVAERPARNGVVPGSIPGLAFSFSSYSGDIVVRLKTGIG